jgi:2-amino-4-hydroxy-6-hydroxymethyldihydropteridine diphosphokinase
MMGAMCASHLVHIGVGTNDHRLSSLRTGWQLLCQLGEIVDKSWVYETVAVGVYAPEFWNGVLVLKTKYNAKELKQRLRDVENLAGRVRYLADGRKNPLVTLDLDILLVDGIGNWQDIINAAHIIVPLADVLPKACIPDVGERVEVVAQRKLSQVKRLPDLRLNQQAQR